MTKLNKFFIFSLLLHTAIIFLILTIFSRPHDTYQVVTNVVRTYSYQEITKSAATNFKHIIAKKNNIFITKKKISSSAKSQINSTYLNEKSINEKEKERILTILHTAIALKQYYPATAIALHQTGTVAISFMLYPDGHLEQVKIAKSSGFSAIDEAAKDAVNAISPVAKIATYLVEPAYFTIDIIFEE